MASKQRDEVIEYARTHLGESAGAIAARFGEGTRNVQRWLSAAGVSRPPCVPGATKSATKAKEPKPKGKRKSGGKAKGSATKEGEGATSVELTKEKSKKRALPRVGGRQTRPQVPAKDLSAEERARLMRIIDKGRRITEGSLQAVLDDWEAWEIRRAIISEIDDPLERAEAMGRDPRPAMDSRQAQANLNHQKMVESMLATHPGLMELAAEDAPADSSGTDKERSTRQRAALLGVKAGDTDE